MNWLRDIQTHRVGLTIMLIMVIITWISANLFWGDERWFRIVKDDGVGYYAYLPAVFIYQDLTFSYLDEFENESNPMKAVRGFQREYKGHPVDKYYAGTALAWTPFFLLGHLITLFTDYPPDGYSAWYLIMVNAGTLFYLLAGMVLLVLILRMFTVGENVIVLVLLAVVFGTNLLHYTITEPSMSHLYSFAFVNLFIYSLLRFFASPKTSFFIIAMMALGVITLIRPVNILVVLSIPFIADSVPVLSDGLKFLFRKPIAILAGILVFLFIVGIQLIIYKIQTGDFFVYSYREEGFDFLRPHFLEFLVSYRKGFFVYTPIALLALFGIYFIYRENKFRAVVLILFYALVVYILSSWYMWYYGGSFSQRPMVEYLTFFMIPLACLLDRSKYKKLISYLTILLIAVCIIQTIQYKSGYIHWSDMNKERYWDNFLRIDKVLKGAEKDW